MNSLPNPRLRGYSTRLHVAPLSPPPLTIIPGRARLTAAQYSLLPPAVRPLLPYAPPRRGAAVKDADISVGPATLSTLLHWMPDAAVRRAAYVAGMSGPAANAPELMR